VKRSPISPSAAALLALAALACGEPVEPITPCAPHGDARPVCGLQNPEDLALLPDGSGVVVSEYGGMQAEHAGRLSLLDATGAERRVLFEGGRENGGTPGPWGDPDCAGPPARDTSPHGIDLARRPDGRLQLLVVTHGEREAVELFEVLRSDAGWTLAWRGCALPPDGSWLNDVVALPPPEGGFLVTHMLPRRWGPLQVFELLRAAVFGARSGHVLAWRPGEGFAPVPGSDALFPNGLEVSADGATLFVNSTLGDEVLRIDRESGTLTGRAAVPRPDNSTWAADGRLLVASLRGDWDTLMSCDRIERGVCPLPYAIVAVDPESLATEVVHESGPDTPMGAATVALPVGGELWLGTFAGDRILRVPFGS